MRQLVKENTALRRLYYLMQIIRAQSQSDETEILARLTADAPPTFVEFGFHPVQFNCAGLARLREWKGLLIDGNARQVADARALLPNRIEIAECSLTLDNLDFVRSFFLAIRVLSIDVDGNDYWFPGALLDARPSVICIEYNSTLGFEPITVPYDPAFDRHQKRHHGASLTALAKLCSSHRYGLAAVSEAGGNAFFTRNGGLNPEEARQPSALRQQYSGVCHADQWQAIRHLPFVAV